MATVSASAEKLAEIKAEEAKTTNEVAATAESEPAPSEVKTAEEASETAPVEPKGDEDVVMDENESDKALRAVRQST